MSINYKPVLKLFWSKFFQFDWKFGLFLILLFCVPRFLLVLEANVTSSYKYISFIMIASALSPFVFLTKNGRRKIGITNSKNYYWLIYSFLIGIIFSLLLYYLGIFLYENTYSNWYNYIGRTYNIQQGISQQDKRIYFIISAITGMIFSPLGEELFFRGIVHSSIANSLGDSKASIIDSSAFAVTHISHFGLIFIFGEWKFLIFPTILWVLSMFLISRLFFYCKKYSGSIVGSIICHSGFNLGMTYSIFYLL